MPFTRGYGGGPPLLHRSRSTLLTVVACATAVTACAGGPEVEELVARPFGSDEVTSADIVPVPDPDGEAPDGEAPPADEASAATPAPEDGPAPDGGDGPPEDAGDTPGPDVEEAPAQDADHEPRAVTPSDRHVSGYLAEVAADAVEHDHLRVDLAGDDLPELAVVTRTGSALTLRVAAWDGGDGYVTVGELEHDEVAWLGTPAARDLTEDGRLEVLLPHTSAAGPAVAVAAVDDDGSASPLSACPLPAPARYALRFRRGAPESVVLGCEEGDLTWDGHAFTAAEAS